MLELSEKYKRSVAQIVLRWHIQRGIIIIPKAVHTQHIENNIHIYDFALSQEDMLRIDELDTGASTIYNKHDPKFVKTICSLKVR